MTIMPWEMPIITLSNGLRVGNFSSPHPFTFTDGSVLPACSDDRAERGKLDAVEILHDGIKGTKDIEISFKLNPIVREMIDEADHINCDVVLVPFPVLRAMKDEGLPLGKLRVIRSANRITKTIHIDRFCI
jgi:hypothetical protein